MCTFARQYRHHSQIRHFIIHRDRTNKQYIIMIKLLKTHPDRPSNIALGKTSENRPERIIRLTISATNKKNAQTSCVGICFPTTMFVFGRWRVCAHLRTLPRVTKVVVFCYTTHKNRILPATQHTTAVDFATQHTNIVFLFETLNTHSRLVCDLTHNSRCVCDTKHNNIVCCLRHNMHKSLFFATQHTHVVMCSQWRCVVRTVQVPSTASFQYVFKRPTVL